uniref:TBC1 domain family member 16 n=1 Tax=Ascaris suum TaxID=6253 RepID=F1KVQ5_ASCSU
MAAISDFLKKAHGAINNLRGGSNFFLGKDGDVVYSKNNVCVHDSTSREDAEDTVLHTPGYLTIHCQNDEQFGVTLVLQWLPNTTLEKNPASIRCVSPRSQHRENHIDERTKLRHLEGNPLVTVESSDDEDIEQRTSDAETTTQDSIDDCSAATDPEISVEMNGDMITVTSMADRPSTLVTQVPGEGEGGLLVPSINVIPNTPVDSSKLTTDEEARSESSATTSGADEISDKDDQDAFESSSCDDSEGDSYRKKSRDSANFAKTSTILEQYRENCATLYKATPEQFARAHNLMLEADTKTDGNSTIAVASGRAMFHQKTNSPSLFSVNLGKMRSMRLFFSNSDCTSGQLVIASHDSQYKILHFHHGGLDKLAQLFEQWSAVKARSVKDGSPSPFPDRHLLICHPEVSRTELDPEDGLYERVSWDFWKSYKNSDGSIEDSFTVRKAIYFASVDPSLRKEIWPFLLRVYPWTSTLEQRETIRNDLFLEYQNIRKKRMKKSMNNLKMDWTSIENTISKDVVRTDRGNPFYAGDDNPNMEVMKNILMNYATVYPDINYIQGMSDLLAPLLSTIRDESDTYWCFVGLMQQTMFSSAPASEGNIMDVNLEYLRELLKLLVPDFFRHLITLGGDALQLMFVHRWILLCFKREFPEADALHIWEACWARYRTTYFHLFVCIAIVSVYGGDVIQQRLPHDEILLYFSSLAMHMDASVVLKKARGLLYHFYRLERVPCTLAGLCELDTEQWDSHVRHHVYECTRVHADNEPCPFANSDM